jgi:integrase
VPIHERRIKVDDDVIQKVIPQMRKIGHRMVWTDEHGKPVRMKNGLYVLAWHTRVYADSQRLTPMRAMTELEVIAIAKSMTGLYAIRDRAWFILGTYCGLRVSQLSMLTVADVFEYGGIRPVFTIPLLRRRSHPEYQQKDMHPAAAEALHRWVQVLQRVYPKLPGDFPLFNSRKADDDGLRHNPRRQTYWGVIRNSCKAARVEIVTDEGRLCTESMYKTYLAWAHQANGFDILAIARLAGHISVATTARALKLDVAKADERFQKAHQGIKKNNS